MTATRTLRAVLFGFVLLSSLVTLTACNTTKGAGKDMENAGEKIQEKAEDAKH